MDNLIKVGGLSSKTDTCVLNTKGNADREYTFANLDFVKGITSFTAPSYYGTMTDLKYCYNNVALITIGIYVNNGGSLVDTTVVGYEGDLSQAKTETLSVNVSATYNTETTQTLTFTHKIKCIKSIVGSTSSSSQYIRQNAPIKRLSISGNTITIVTTNCNTSTSSALTGIYEITIYY